LKYTYFCNKWQQKSARAKKKFPARALLLLSYSLLREKKRFFTADALSAVKNESLSSGWPVFQASLSNDGA